MTWNEVSVSFPGTASLIVPTYPARRVKSDATAQRVDGAATSPSNKLPQITLAFWVMKICATTLGETAGDLFSMTLDVGYTVSSLVLVGAFAILLVSQLKAAW